MKNSMKVLSFIFVATIALTTAQTASASVECTQRVVFGCLATGKSFVAWDVLPEGEEPAYIESSRGSIACVGSALVVYSSDGLYMAEPGSICCFGFLVASWIHDEENYRLGIVFYSIEETPGFFLPEADYFALATWAVIPTTMMQFKGILVENGDRLQISGVAGLIVASHQYDYTPQEAETISLFLLIDLGEELPDQERWLPVALGWVDRPVTLPSPWPECTPVEKAEVFRHSVKLLDHSETKSRPDPRTSLPLFIFYI